MHGDEITCTNRSAEQRAFTGAVTTINDGTTERSSANRGKEDHHAVPRARRRDHRLSHIREEIN